MRTKALICCLVLSFLGSAGCVLEKRDAGVPGKRTAESWKAQLATASAELRSGQFEQALARIEKVIREMVDSLGPKDDEAELFGYAVALKAVALEGLGDRAAATWYWRVAQGIDPNVATIDLSAYGAPGEFLKGSVLGSPKASSQAGAGQPAEEPAHYPGNDGVSIPVPIKKPEPVYPKGARAFKFQGTLVVQAVIDRQGVIAAPRVLKPFSAPTLTYAALEAIKQWRFKPAERAGEPFPVYYNLTMTFHVGQ